jgi:hypothetical protein
LPVGESALALAVPDWVTSLQPEYLFSPESALTGKGHASSFLIKTRFSSLPFSSHSFLFFSTLSLFYSLFQVKRENEEKKKREREISDFSVRRKRREREKGRERKRKGKKRKRKGEEKRNQRFLCERKEERKEEMRSE